MKLKRLLVFLLAIMMLLSVMPAAYAAEISEESSTTEPTVNASDQLEQTEPSVMEDSSEPAADEYDGELDPVLVEAGFTSDQLQAGNVLLEPISTFAASTRSVTKTATLRNCNWMDFPCTDDSRQGFHYADEDGASPWDYMNIIYCLENKKDFSYGSGHTGVGELPLDGSGDSHGESIWYGFSADQRTAIALVMLYGAPTKLWDDSWGINATDDWNLHNPNIGYRFATQAIIWEFVQGLREPTPPYKLNSTYWLDKSQGVCMSEDGKVDHFMYAYNSIINDLQLHNTIPSFAGDFAATAPEIQLAGTSTTVTDTNGVLGRFTFTGSGGVSYSKNGNNLIITATGAIPTGIQSATATLPDAASSLYEVWYNQYDTSKQVCIKVAIPASDPVPAYFKLKASTGSMSLQKTTEDNLNKNGWKFGVYSDQNCTQLIAGPITSDTQGNLNISELPAGDVWVKELGHQDPNINALYECASTNPQKVTITSGKTATVTFHNKLRYGSITFRKATTSGVGVELGWTANLWKIESDGAKTFIGSGTTKQDKNDPTYTFEKLLPGKYLLQEDPSSAKYGYSLDATAYEVTVSAGQNTPVTITNESLGFIEILKETNTGKDVAGRKFNIFTDEARTQLLPGSPFESDSNGRFLTEAKPGVYFIQELDESVDNPGWIFDTTVHRVEVKAHETATVKFTNIQQGYGQIIKDMPDGGSGEGWAFDLHRASDNAYIATYTTGSDSTVNTDWLLPGEYLVYEKIADDSLYYCESENPQRITIVAGEVTKVTFVNRLKPAKIEGLKTDSYGNPLPGSSFLLEWSEDGTTWQPVTYTDSPYVTRGTCTSVGLENGILTSGEDGIVSFMGLHPEMYYRMTEVSTVNGAQLMADTIFEGQIPTDDLAVAIEVVNNSVFVLPHTGSKSLVLMPVSIGLCLLICAGALFTLRKKEKSC